HPSFLGLREDKPAQHVVMETPKDSAPPVPAEPAKTPAAKARDKTAASAIPDPVELTTTMGVAAAKAVGVTLTHPERVVYPEDAVTKGEVAAYYAHVAERMLPHLAG